MARSAGCALIRWSASTRQVQPDSRAARRHGSRRPRRLRMDRHPHRPRLPPRLRDSTKLLGAGRRSRTATAGRTPSERRCSPASSPSTPCEPPRKSARAKHPVRPAGHQRQPDGFDTGERRHLAPISGSRSRDPSGILPMNESAEALRQSLIDYADAAKSRISGRRYLPKVKASYRLKNVSKKKRCLLPLSSVRTSSRSPSGPPP